jgi:hypothetical protein
VLRRAAHALGIPTLVHESNAVSDRLTTKLLAGTTVDCVSWSLRGRRGRNYPKGTKRRVHRHAGARRF